MRAKFYLIILSVLASFMSHSQSLVAGDIAFVGYNTDAGPAAGQDHSFSFIALTDIPAGEIIYFTEEGWNDVSNTWAGTDEGHAQWTAPAGGVSCGTVVFVTESGVDVFTVSSGTISLVSGSAGWNLTGGDQVLAYYAATPEPATTPTFISGVNGDDGNGSPVSFNSTTQWNDPSTGPLGTAKSGLPAGLTNGVNCVSLFVTTFTEMDNAKYTGTLTGTSTALRAAINDRTNWTFDDVNAFDISPAGYSPSVTCVAPCTDPTIPTITASANPICAGGSTTLNITGTLNDATAWHVYTGFCGVTPVGTTAGTTFTVSPTTTTSYYIRGEGGCVTPGTCGAITVTVNPADDASFGYSTSSYCVNAADPTPTITGTTGGSFSSTAGLSINASTGTIDVSASTPGTYTVTYTTAGPCPNSSNVSVTINALDDPSFAYGTSSFCVNTSDPMPTITGLAGGTFSSTAGLSINSSTGTIDVSASTPGTYIVTYTTSGACPSSSNVSVTIIGLDDASFSYSAAAYCVNAADPTPTVTGVPGGSFFSGGGLPIDGSTGTIDVSATTPGTYTVTYMTTGTCPNSSTFSVTINGLDDPSFSYSASSYCVNAADPTPTITGLAGGTFSSTAGLSINATTGQVDVSASTPGTYTVTYTTSGSCPSSSNVSLTVNALDNASFSYSAASYCVAETDPTPTVTGVAGGSFSSTAGLSLNASTGTIDVSASTPGTYSVSYTTTGACPNSVSVSVTITALDDASFSYSAASYCLTATDPVATITGTTGGSFSSTAGLSINGTTGTIDASASTPGTYTVTYATTGACANSSTQSVTITTPPTAPSVTTPIVVCSGNDVMLSATGSGTGNIAFYDGTMTQLFSGAMPPATVTTNLGVLTNGTYFFTATENNGGCESAPTTIEVFVGDTTDPVAVCQNITVFLDGTGMATITASDLDGGSTDNCGPVTLAASQTSFDCSDINGSATGTLILTGVYDAGLTGGLPKGVELYVANDIADLSQYGLGSANNGGGTDGQEFTFPATSVSAGTYIYVASEAPQFTSFFGFAPDYTDGSMGINGDDAIELFHMGSVIDVFGDINVDGTGQTWDYEDGWAYRNNGTGPDGSAFGLGNWTYSGLDAFTGAATNTVATPVMPIGTFMPASSGSTPVILTVTDGSGNTSICTANVTVVDSTSPVIVCPGDQTEFLSASCSFVLPDYTGLATATDNCGTPVITQSPAAGTAITADQVVTLTATDGNGNTQTCSFDVFVSDNSAPTAVCQNITVYLDGAGNATITASDIDGGSTDNCGPVTLSASQTSFTCADVGLNTVTLTATDGNANSASCTATVTVADTVAPIVVCPGDQTETASATCDFILPDYIGLVTASDNCGAVTVTQSPIPGTVITSDQVITMTGVDSNGNSSTCTFNVLLTGATPPTAVCQNITVYLDGSGNASITASDIDGGSTATCGGLTLSASVTSFTCADLGTNNVTLTATDGGGNTDDCIAVVTVVDTITPVPDAASLPEVIAECEVTSLTDPTALDNCGAVTVTNDATFPIATQGSTTVTWTFDDGNGNTTTQTQVVTIIDSNSPLPTAAPLPDVVGQCSVDALPAAPTAIDACAGAITGVLITPITFPVTTQGTTVIVWQFDDGNGNISTQSQNIIVNDVTGPVPNTTTLPALTGDCSIDMPTAPTATDNCAGAITGTTSTVFPITAIGTTTIVWEFNDGNGNFTTQTQLATNSGIDASATLESDGVTITANTSGGTYAWLNCDFNTVIAGETGQSFTPVANGVYAAIVTLGNCTDTSACITVSSVGVNDLSIEKLSVYPNPSLDGFFTVNFEGNIEAIDVVDMLGRTMVLPTDVSTGVVDGSELAQGRYMVRVLTEGTIITTEIVIVK